MDPPSHQSTFWRTCVIAAHTTIFIGFLFLNLGGISIWNVDLHTRCCTVDIFRCIFLSNFNTWGTRYCISSWTSPFSSPFKYGIISGYTVHRNVKHAPSRDIFRLCNTFFSRDHWCMNMLFLTRQVCVFYFDTLLLECMGKRIIIQKRKYHICVYTHGSTAHDFVILTQLHPRKYMHLNLLVEEIISTRWAKTHVGIRKTDGEISHQWYW